MPTATTEACVPPVRVVSVGAPSASPEPYRVYLRSGWHPAVAARRVEFEGFDGWDLFLHHIEGGLRVSERLTGLAVVSAAPGIAATFDRDEDALDAAGSVLAKWGAGGFAQTVVRVLLARGGAS